jgi:hypothetical protein
VERGLAVVAVIPEAQRDGFATPTRGMVAWVHSGLGACETDDVAVATARLIAAAPTLLAACKLAVAVLGNTDAAWHIEGAIACAEGRS